MTPEVAQAQRAITQLRTEISKFQRLRTANNEIIAGMRAGKVPWDRAKQIAADYRDVGMEESVVDSLKKLIEMLRQGETGAGLPTLEDPLPPGIEGGLGWLPWVAGSVIALAAATLSGFSYIRTREERIMEETRGPVASMLHQLGENTWALAALGVVGLGAVIYYDTRYRAFSSSYDRFDR